MYLPFPKNCIRRKLGLCTLTTYLFRGNCFFKEAFFKLFLNTGGCEGFLFQNQMVLTFVEGLFLVGFGRHAYAPPASHVYDTRGSWTALQWDWPDSFSAVPSPQTLGFNHMLWTSGLPPAVLRAVSLPLHVLLICNSEWSIKSTFLGHLRDVTCLPGI